MNQNTYINTILEPIVKPWLQAVKASTIAPFVLEENRDSAHGIKNKKKTGIIEKWKQEHSLQYYFNCRCSPDLAPIENC